MDKKIKLKKYIIEFLKLKVKEIWDELRLFENHSNLDFKDYIDFLIKEEHEKMCPGCTGNESLGTIIMDYNTIDAKIRRENCKKCNGTGVIK